MKDRERQLRFGRHLRRLREERTLGLRELAREVSTLLRGRGLSATYLSAIENGAKPAPRPKILKALAHVLEVSPAEIEWVARGWHVELLSRHLSSHAAYGSLLRQMRQRKATRPELLSALAAIQAEIPLKTSEACILHFDSGGEVLIVTRPNRPSLQSIVAPEEELVCLPE